MLGTSMLWVEGQISSYFFPEKMSMPTKCTCAGKRDDLQTFKMFLLIVTGRGATRNRSRWFQVYLLIYSDHPEEGRSCGASEVTAEH